MNVKIRKIRLSVTDRCNFRCFYCYSRDFIPLKKEETLSYEDFLFFVDTISSSGIDTIKITGGEPLFKRDIEVFIKRLNEIKILKDISITTNGFFLAEKAEILKKSGLKRINISIDSFDRKKIKNITGRDSLEEILEGIKISTKLFSPVKINVVLLKGINTDEIFNFINFASKLKIFVRFIELMPSANNSFWERFYFSEKLLLNELKKKGKVEYKSSNGHENFYNFEGINFGVIPSYSKFFCGSCNKVRIDCAGNLKLCIYDKKNYPLKNFIKNRDNENLIKEFFKILKNKKSYKGKTDIFEMVRIGG